MKGIILAGGSGTRLHPMTLATNKSLLPVYDKPMIFYPLMTLAQLGIKEILIVVSGTSAGDVLSVVQNGTSFGFRQVLYAYQQQAAGIADALSLARHFAGVDPIAVILGDNTTDANLSTAVKKFNESLDDLTPMAHVFLKEIDNPRRFGVAEIDGELVKSIEEKPSIPKTNLAVTGFYLYDHHVWNVIDNLKPSNRGEYEITDVNNWYIQNGKLLHSHLDGFWQDAGTPDALMRASNHWMNKK